MLHTDEQLISAGKLTLLDHASNQSELDDIVTGMLDERIAVASANARRGIEAPEKLIDHLLDQYRFSLHSLTSAPCEHRILAISIRLRWPVIHRHFEQFHGIVTAIIEEGIRAGSFGVQDPISATRRFAARTNPIWDPATVAMRFRKAEQYSPYEKAWAAVRRLI